MCVLWCALMKTLSASAGPGAHTGLPSVYVLWCALMKTLCALMKTLCLLMKTLCLLMKTLCLLMKTLCLLMKTLHDAAERISRIALCGVM